MSPFSLELHRLIKQAEERKNKSQLFREGAGEVVLPAIGGLAGAGLAKAYGAPVFVGEVLGSAVGAGPAVIKAIMEQRAAAEAAKLLATGARVIL